MTSAPQTRILAGRLGEELLRRRWRVITAESLTGGGVAAALTAVAGSSAWLFGGFVTYAMAAKRSMLGVPEDLLQRHGAVSEPVARAMAEGAALASGCEFAIATTGIAGPGGGEVLQAVGSVWICWVRHDQHARAALYRFPGDREAIRQATIDATLSGAIRMLTDTS